MRHGTQLTRGQVRSILDQMRSGLHSHRPAEVHSIAGDRIGGVLTLTLSVSLSLLSGLRLCLIDDRLELCVSLAEMVSVPDALHDFGLRFKAREALRCRLSTLRLAFHVGHSRPMLHVGTVVEADAGIGETLQLEEAGIPMAWIMMVEAPLPLGAEHAEVVLAIERACIPREGTSDLVFLQQRVGHDMMEGAFATVAAWSL